MQILVGSEPARPFALLYGDLYMEASKKISWRFRGTLKGLHRGYVRATGSNGGAKIRGPLLPRVVVNWSLCRDSEAPM